jgi:hypothetical protein
MGTQGQYHCYGKIHIATKRLSRAYPVERTARNTETALPRINMPNIVQQEGSNYKKHDLCIIVGQ